MANITETARHDRERGLILEYLAVAGSKGATPGELRRYLKLMGRPVTVDGLDFHIRMYLAPKGYVSFSEGTGGDPNDPTAITFVLITPAGIDRRDGRESGDDGVAF